MMIVVKAVQKYLSKGYPDQEEVSRVAEIGD